MEKKHRDLLINNRMLIIQNMANPLDVVDMLYEKNIFTDAMKDKYKVEAEKTQDARVRKILDLVPRKGPLAFDAFCQIMVNTKNYTIAKALGVEVQGHVVEQPGDVLVNEWPNEAAMSAPLNVVPCKKNSDIVRENWDNPYVYRMRNANRGKCLLISNENFNKPDLKTRTGTEKDVEKLTELFTQLHFEVIVRRDLKKDDMDNLLKQVSRDDSLENSDCFVCIICSHGTREGIYGTDGEVITYKRVTSYFDARGCPKLQRKPKLFFIQACQGDNYDTTEVDNGPDISALTIGVENMQMTDCTNTADANETDVARSVAKDQDILIAMATHQDYVSFRNQKNGSWFLQAVVYVFQTFAHKESLGDMLTMVNNLVASRETSYERSASRVAKQCSRVKHSFTKKFFFFPGLYD